MAWLQLEMTLDAGEAERVEMALLAAGALSVTCSDAGNQPLYEPDPDHPPIWPHTRLCALFPADANPDALRSVLVAALGALPPHEFRSIEDREWPREWLKDFKPMRFGRHLWIVPSAYTPPDITAVNIRLDPGLAFGTGTHATTSLCLEWLDGAELAEKSLVDYGCGSGVLAIAAARLGARRVWAVDNDPQALAATNENARRNQLETRLEICAPDGLLGIQPVDVLLANILAEPLINLEPRFAALLRTGGLLVLSGILDGQQTEIQAAYADRFQFIGEARRGEWLRLDARRRSGSA